jgi:4-nitrophenyl phosphatase
MAAMMGAAAGTPGGLILDMDGVLYVGERPKPGLVELFAVIGERPFVLVTNNSTLSAADCRARLARMGVAVPLVAILTVSQVVGCLLPTLAPRASRALVLGSPPLRAEVVAAGMRLVHSAAEVVVVGLDRALSHQRLTEAVRSVSAGAALLATSFDPILLTEEGIEPGAGALVAAIAACVGEKAVCVGKPSPLIFEIAAAQLGMDPGQILVVGDSLRSDVAGGQAVGASTALIHSGLPEPGLAGGPAPDLSFDGLVELARWLAERWSGEGGGGGGGGEPG